ncbi:MAG: response regulator, partial [Methylobacter sp.]
AMLMEMMGNNVRMAHDGEKAVIVAKEFRPHVVLLDIGLPKLNGYEAARAIRQEPWGKNIFLIAATGWGQEDDKRKSKEAGFDLHMVKPIDPQALMKLLASLPPEYTLASSA